MGSWKPSETAGQNLCICKYFFSGEKSVSNSFIKSSRRFLDTKRRQGIHSFKISDSRLKTPLWLTSFLRVSKCVFHQRISLVGAGDTGLASSSHQTAPTDPCTRPELLPLWGKDRTLGEVSNTWLGFRLSRQVTGRLSTDHLSLEERQNRNQCYKA